jgi:hypothetical protein
MGADNPNPLHRKDPNEWTNLANIPEYESVKKELGEWIPENPVSACWFRAGSITISRAL